MKQVHAISEKIKEVFDQANLGEDVTYIFTITDSEGEGGHAIHGNFQNILGVIERLRMELLKKDLIRSMQE